MFLELAHGKLLTPPTSIVDAIEQNGRDVDRTWTTVDIGNGERAYRYVQWIREQNIDLMLAPPHNEYGARVVTFDCTVTPAHGENSTNWENMDAVTPNQLNRAIGVLDYMQAFKKAERYGRPLPQAPAEGGIYGSAIQLDSTNPNGPKVNALTLQQSRLWFFETRTGAKGILELSEFTSNPLTVKIRYKLLQAAKRADKVDSTQKRMTFLRPEMEVTNDEMKVAVSSDTPMAPGEHFSAILEMPNGELRTRMFSMATNNTKTSSQGSWEFDPKRDGFWTAAAQDAVSQMNAKLAHPHTFRAGEILPVFSVTNRAGGVMTGSIEYHVHLPQPAPVPAGSIAGNK